MLLLFDAAGTLIHPAEPVEQVYQRHFAKHGWPSDAAALKQGFRETFASLPDPDYTTFPDGDAAERAWWRKIVHLTAARARIPADEEIFTGLFTHYAAGAAWTVYPEVPAMLATCRERGFQLAVVSNFDRRLHRVMEELGLAGHFDLILTSADVSARKPSPKLLETAMAHFSKTPAATRLVGDSARADGGAARAAGIGTFILDRPQTTLLDFAEWLG